MLAGTTRVGPDCFNTFGMQQTLEEVFLPETVAFIGYSAFFHNKELKRITIPDNVAEIGQAAFYQCSKLRSAELGGNLKIIGITAFRLCTELKEIRIPEKVAVIGDEAFAKCPGIKNAVFTGNAPRLKKDDYYTEGIFGRRSDDFRIQYPKGKKGWSDPWMDYRAEEIQTE